MSESLKHWCLAGGMLLAAAILARPAGAEPAAVAEATADAEKSAATLKSLRKALADREFDPAGLADLEWAKVPLTRADAESARAKLWAFQAARLKKAREAEYKARELCAGDLKMPFFHSVHGTKPAGGRSLWISLHGGGGAPPHVNDGQWENQKRLYQVKEGVYLAPRAPTNTWDLWHAPHIDGLFRRLIEDMVLFEDVSPDRVYVLGYSAGGDGVYKLGPRMADCWAAAAMMAGHPNNASMLSLRNVPFALQVGGDDAAFNRNTVARDYGAMLDKLQAEDPKGYLHYVKIHDGLGHWMNGQDAAVLPWMAEHSRNPVPDRVVWAEISQANPRSYWLAVPTGDTQRGGLAMVRREGQTIVVEKSEGLARLIVRLDDRLVDLDEPVKIVQGQKTLFEGTIPRTISGLWSCLADRADESLMFPAAMTVSLE